MTAESRCGVEAWTNLNGSVSMDKTSLMQTIKAHYLTGQFSNDQLSYLSALKDSTISIWAAANELLPKGHSLLPQEDIAEAAFESTIRNWKLPQIVNQIVQWAAVEDGLVSAELLTNLRQLTLWKNGEGECPNPNTVLANLRHTLTEIEGYLSRFLQADIQVEGETRTMYYGADVTFELHPELHTDYWFHIEPGNLCGMELPESLSPMSSVGEPGLRAEYWSALLTGLHSVSRLTPLFTPVDMADNPFIEEINDDLTTIQEAMESAGLDASDAVHVQESIEILADAGEIFIIEDAEMYEYHKSESDDAAESAAQWSDWNSETELATIIERLPEAATETEKKLAAWLADADQAVKAHIKSDEPTCAIHAYPIHIACEGDRFASKYMDSEHRMIMEGRCDDETAPIEFGVPPATIVSEFKQVNAGLKLLARLIEDF